MGPLLPRQFPDRDPAPGPDLLNGADPLLWAVPLGHDLPEGWESILSPVERERAAAFGDPEGKARYVGTRTALRRILGGLLGIAPGAVSLVLAPGGKPVLADGALEFNHAHTDGLALVAAAAPGHPVGVDVEKRGRRANFRAVAARFFTPGERIFLEAEETEERFLALWARKEAVLKAAGTGLSGGLDTFSVAEAEGFFDGVVFGGKGYVLHAVAVSHGYVGAVALRNP